MLLFFTPPWLSGLEQAFLWVGGWKPTLAFRLLRRLKRPLLPEQEAAETRRAELELELEQAKAQERLGSPEVEEAARCGGGGGGGGAEGELTEAAGGGGRTEDEDGGECGRDTVRRSGRRLPGGDGRVRYALRDAAEGGAMAGRPGD